MAFYSVCSLVIESDLLPEKYYPFKIMSDMKPDHIDMTVRIVNDSPMKTDMRIVARLSYMSIWKYIDSEQRTHWVFEPNNHMGTVSVDDQLSDVEIHSIFSDAFDKKSIGEMYGKYIQIILECKLIQKGFTVLHSACVEIDGIAYAFTGPSGIGKSTRAEIWRKLLGAEWISGDRPAINAQTGIVYGVPWDGKEAIYRNYHCPLKAILKVNRSDNTRIQEMNEKEKTQLLCEQTVVPLWNPMLAAQAMCSIKKLIKNVPIFEVFCDITDESLYKLHQIITERTRE